MTRINSNICPTRLIDQHLLAEYNEITRLTTINFSKTHKIPESFRLGTGHVKFFYDKQKFLHKRYLSLREELISRGFKLSTNHEERWLEIEKSHPAFYNDYQFIKEESELSMIRILRSIFKIYSKDNQLRYCKSTISIDSAISLLQINVSTDFDIIKSHLLRNYQSYDDLHLLDNQLSGIEFLKQTQIQYLKKQIQ